MRSRDSQAWRPAWSPTGCVFAASFLVIAIWCLVDMARGHSDPIWLFSFLTLPMSLLLTLVGHGVESSFGLDADAVGWSIALLDLIWGVLMFYFLGWLLERPLRR